MAFLVPSILGTSSSRSRLSTGIWDCLIPGLIFGRETFRNSRTLPEVKLISLISALVENFPTGTDLLIKFSTCQYFSRRVPFLIINLYKTQFFLGFFPIFLEWRDQKKVVLSHYRQFGKWGPVSSCLVLLLTSSGTQTFTWQFYIIITSTWHIGLQLQQQTEVCFN